MKTPEEIKKGLGCCMDYQSCTEYGEPKCPYNDVTKCMEALLADALVYIQRLEETIGSLKLLNETMYDEAKKGIQELESRLAQVERERDALMESAKGCCETCAFVGDCAKHDPDPTSTGAWWYDDCEEWQWRGVCPENTKED